MNSRAMENTSAPDTTACGGKVHYGFDFVEINFAKFVFVNQYLSLINI